MSDQYANDPNAQQLAGAVGADGVDALGKVAGVHNAIMGGIQHNANANIQAGGFWHDTTHFLSGAWNGFVNGTGEIIKGVADTVKRTAVTTAELATGGFLGTQGIGHFAGNLADAQQTFANVGKEAVNIANLSTFKHIASYYESMVRRYGWGYTLGHATPAVLTALMGGEVLTGAGMGTEAVDAATVANYAKLLESGAATTEDFARYAGASARLARKQDAQLAFEDARMATEQEMAKKMASGTVKGMNKVGNALYKETQFGDKTFKWGIGTPFRAIGQMAKATNGLKAQMLYGLTQQQALANPELQHLWEMTKDGHVIDAHNRDVGTFGQTLADILGLQQQNWERSLVSGGIDASTMFMGDPFAAAAKIKEGINSAQGFGGLAGKWWKGIGIETGNDVWHSWDKTAQSRRAFNFMATRSAEEIDRAFKGFYPPDVLERLGNADTVEKVVEIHAELADAHALAMNVLPTLKMTRTVGNTLTRFIMANAGNLQVRDAELIPEFEKYFEKFGIAATPTSAEEATASRFGERAILIARRLVAKQFEQTPWVVEEATRLGELPSVQSKTFRLGDKRAIEPLLRAYKATGLWNNYEIESLGKVLRGAPTNDDFYHAYINLTASMLLAATKRNPIKLDKLVLDAEAHDYIKGVVRNMIDMGIGGKGEYINGLEGQTYSRAYSETDATQFGMYGVGDSHLGRPKFLDPRQLVGLVNNVNKVMASAETGVENTLNELRLLDEAALERNAVLKGVTLKGSVGRIYDNIQELKTKFDNSLTIDQEIPTSDYYHGSSQRIEKLSDIWSSDSTNLFGPGFYTTDSAEVARSYTGKGEVSASAEGTLNKTVHGVKWKGSTPPKMLDLEQSAPNFLRQMIEDSLQELNVEPSSLIYEVLDNPNATGSEVYDAFRRELQLSAVNKDEYFDAYDRIQSQLEHMGYDGLAHTGGGRVAGSDVKHNVNIFWEPEKKLEIIGFTSPKAVDPMAKSLAQGADAAFNAVRDIIANTGGKARFANVANEVSKATQELEGIIAKAQKTRTDYTLANERAFHLAMQTGDHASIDAAKALENVTDEEMAVLRGRLAGMRMAEKSLFAQLSGSKMTMKDFRQLLWDKQAGTQAEKETQKKLRQEISMQFEKARPKNDSYLDFSGHAADYANMVQTRWFIPQMLSTGGYIMRIATAEILPSLFRIGPKNFIESAISRSIARNVKRGFDMGKEERKLLAKEVSSAINTLLESEGVSNISKARRDEIAKEIGANRNAIVPAGKRARQFMVGALTGAERALVQSLDPERGARLINDAISAFAITNGHLPDIGHHSTGLMDPDSAANGMSQEVYGVDKEGNPAKSRAFQQEGWTKATGEHIANALQENIARHHVDSVMNSAVKSLEQIVSVEGPKAFASKSAQDALLSRLTDKVQAHLAAMDPQEYAAFGRSGKVLHPSITTGDSMRDHAKAVAYNAMHVFGGYNKAGEFVLHPELMDQAISGEIQAPQDLAQWISKTDGSPSELISRQWTKAPWRSSDAHGLLAAFDAAMAVPSRINNQTVDRLFGRFIAHMSREPLFIWEYHSVMEELRGHVAQGLIHEDTAQLQALNKAFARMVQYVHNPADRVLIEKNTRWLAPFWFAKNQSYRRAFRFMDENPAAFSYYLRMSMAFTNVLHNAENSQQGDIVIPHTNFLANMFGYGLSGGRISNVGLDLALNPSSLRSVIPTGDSLEPRQFLPDFGSYLSIPLHVGKLFNHSKGYSDFLNTILGPVGSNSPLINDFLPSPLIRGITEMGTFGLVNYDISQGALVNLQQDAYSSVLHEKWNSFIQEYEAKFPDMPTDQQHSNAVAYADYKMTMLYQDKKAWDSLTLHARLASLGMFATKMMSSFFAPAATNLVGKFTAYNEFNKIMKQKNPDGSPISYQQGMQEFSIKHPELIMDMVSRSESPYGSFSQAKDFNTWHDANPSLFTDSGVPNFMSYMVPRGGAEDQTAHQLQVALGLRSKANTDEFYTNFMTTLGNDYYYRYIEPNFYQQWGRWEGENSPNNYIYSLGRNQMLDLATKYGELHNSAWLKNGSPFGTVNKAKQQKAIEQANTFVNTRSMYQPYIDNGLLTQQEIKTLKKALEFKTKQEQTMLYMTNGSTEWGMRQSMNNYFNQLALDPKNATIAYFLTNVLARSQKLK